MACDNVCGVVLNNLVFDCNNKAVGGINQTIKLINRCDINVDDWTIDTGSTDECSHQIEFTGTDPASLGAITVSAMPGKRLLRAAFSISNDEYGWYYTHMVDLFSQGLSQSALCNIKALGNGAELVAIVEQNYKGQGNLDAFQVYGWHTGLKLSDLAFDSNENNGNTIIPLSSLDPGLEPEPPYTLLMTDYETTKAFFDSL